MTTGHVFMAMSLDGYVARRDGGLDWLMKHQTEGENHGYDAFMASVDGWTWGEGHSRRSPVSMNGRTKNPSLS